MAHVVRAKPPDTVRSKARTSPGAHLLISFNLPLFVFLPLLGFPLFGTTRLFEIPPSGRSNAIWLFHPTPSSSNLRLTAPRDLLNHIFAYIGWPPLHRENKRGVAQTRALRSAHPRSCKAVDGIAFIRLQDIYVAVHVLSCFVTDCIAIVPTLAAAGVLQIHPIPQAPWLPWTPGGSFTGKKKRKTIGPSP